MREIKKEAIIRKNCDSDNDFWGACENVALQFTRLARQAYRPAELFSFIGHAVLQ